MPQGTLQYTKYYTLTLLRASFASAEDNGQDLGVPTEKRKDGVEIFFQATEEFKKL